MCAIYILVIIIIIIIIKITIIIITPQITLGIPFTQEQSPSALLAAAVFDKIEDGNMRAAVRFMRSEDKLAEHSSETFFKLFAKHPSAAIDRKPPKAPDGFAAPLVSESEVLKTIRSFPAGTPCGPDGSDLNT